MTCRKRHGGSAPAVPRFRTKRRTPGIRTPDEGAGGDSLERLLHHDHRMPAPSVSAIEASSATAMVKRARIAFTELPFRSCQSVGRTGSWAVSWYLETPGFASPLRNGFALDSPVTEGTRPSIGKLRDHRAGTPGAEVPIRAAFGGVVGRHRTAGQAIARGPVRSGVVRWGTRPACLRNRDEGPTTGSARRRRFFDGR